MLKPGIYVLYDVTGRRTTYREEDYSLRMRGREVDWAATAVKALEKMEQRAPLVPSSIELVDERGKIIDYDLSSLLMLAEHFRQRPRVQRNPASGQTARAKFNAGRLDGTDPEANRIEIEQMLKSAPSDWRSQFASGMSARAASGQPHGGTTLNLNNALLILGITAGGNASGDRASGSNAVPSAVRAAAMKGLRLSHAHNYGAWKFIGIARAIQLATQPGVPTATMSRMANYFGRHVKDQSATNFGNDSSPSRGYMAWLNWGGDPGFEWASSTKKVVSKTKQPQVAKRNYSQADVDQMLRGKKNLDGADFSHYKAPFGLDLQGVNLTGANLSNSTWYDVNFDRATLDKMDATRAKFVSPSMRLVSGEHAKMQNTHIAKGDLRLANFMNSSFENAWVSGSDLSNADFDFADITAADFEDNDLHRTRFVTTTFKEDRPPVFDKTELQNAQIKSLAVGGTYEVGTAGKATLATIKARKGLTDQTIWPERVFYQTTEYSGTAQRMCESPNKVFMLITTGNAKNNAFMAVYEANHEHPKALYENAVLGWVRVCQSNDQQNWVIEEVQTDVESFRRPKLIDERYTTDDEMNKIQLTKEQLEWLKSTAKRVYTDLMAMVISIAHNHNVQLWMLTDEVKRTVVPNAPSSIYKKLPKDMGFSLKKFPAQEGPFAGLTLWCADLPVKKALPEQIVPLVTSNPLPQSWGKKAVVLDLGGMGHQPLHGGEHWDERVKQRVKEAPLPVRLQLYDIYRKVRGHKNREFMTSERVNIQWDGAPGKRGNYLIVQYNQGEPFMVTVLINMTLDSAASGRSRTVQADQFFSEPLTFKVDRSDVDKRQTSVDKTPPETPRPLSRKQREQQMMAGFALPRR